MSAASQTRGDIYEWAWVNPGDPTQGVYQSTVVCPGGSGAYAVPSADLEYLDLTQAYLIGADLTSAILWSINLTNANLNNANLTNAALQDATLTNATLNNARLYYANLTNSNLTRASLWGARLTNANLTNANLANAHLSFGTLTNANLSNATLTNANLYSAKLTNAKLTNANLTNAVFFGASLTSANLTNANLSGSTLTLANLTGADLRGAQGVPLGSAITTNTILPDGTIQGLNLNATNPTLLVRNYSGSSSIPIHVLQGMSMNPGTSLAFQLDGNPWGSTISFAAGIPVTLGGNVELGLAPGVDPTGLLGQFFQLFNWTGVSPSGQFAQVVSDLPTRYLWNTSALYTFGGVALTISPTPINGQWGSNGSGMWSGTANWTGGNVPGAPQDTAVFRMAFSSGTATVTLDSVVSLAGLAFSATGGASYLFNPSYACALILSNTAGSATISNGGGNNTIAVPITLGSNLSVSASPGSDLTIAAAISESGGSCSLTLSGGGELILSGSNSYTGGTTVDAGVLIVTNNEALADGSSLTVGNASLFQAPVAPSLTVSSAPAITTVPEPGSLALFTTAVCGAAVYQRLRSRRKKQ